MEKVRPWCGQPSNRGRLKDRTDANGISLKTLNQPWRRGTARYRDSRLTSTQSQGFFLRKITTAKFLPSPPPFLSLLSPSPSLCPFPLSSPPILFRFFSHFSPFPFPITLFTFSSPQNLVRKHRAALLALPDLPLELHKLGLELHI